MKKVFLIISVLSSFALLAQSRDEVLLLSNVRALHKAVFADKDSATLEKLFATGLTYGHSSGKLENKKEAIMGISQNKSVYADLTISGVSVWMENKTAITRHVMTANEKLIDGKINPLKLHIMLVWTKAKEGWKVIARQAVKM